MVKQSSAFTLYCPYGDFSISKVFALPLSIEGFAEAFMSYAAKPDDGVKFAVMENPIETLKRLRGKPTMGVFTKAHIYLMCEMTVLCINKTFSEDAVNQMDTVLKSRITALRQCLGVESLDQTRPTAYVNKDGLNKLCASMALYPEAKIFEFVMNSKEIICTHMGLLLQGS